MNTVRLGILGFAHPHVDSYCERWRQEPALGVQLVTGWDHDPARAAAACRRQQMAPAASPRELLARKDVEAVVIASETSAHADLVEQAAAAGKAVVLQKPMALTLAEADRIVAAVERYRGDLRTRKHYRELWRSAQLQHPTPAGRHPAQVVPGGGQAVDGQRFAGDPSARRPHRGPGGAAGRLPARPAPGHRDRRRRSGCPAHDAGLLCIGGTGAKDRVARSKDAGFR